MSSRVRELAEFLREDPMIVCAAFDGAEEQDPYTAAAKRILFCVHLSELPAPARQEAGRRGQARTEATTAGRPAQELHERA